MPVTVLHKAKNWKPIENVYVFLSIDENGNEGICAVESPFGPIQAVTADMERAKDVESRIAEIAKITKCRIRLVKFTTKDILKTYEP